MVRDEWERHDSAEIDSSAMFSSLARANDEARQRFVAYLRQLEYVPDPRHGRFNKEGEEDGEEDEKDAEEEEEAMHPDDQNGKTDASLLGCGARIRTTENGEKSYSYGFPDREKEGDAEGVELERLVEFGVSRVALDPS